MLRDTQCPIENVITRDLWDRLLHFFNRLHMRYQFVLTEHYLKGRTRLDIARELGLCKSKVDQLVWKAERILRRRMGLERQATPPVIEPKEDASPWLMKKQVCFRLGIKEDVLSDWIKEGKFPQAGSTVGARQLWHRDIVDNFVVQE
jgi:hypothetical protein